MVPIHYRMIRFLLEKFNRPNSYLFFAVIYVFMINHCTLKDPCHTETNQVGIFDDNIF